MSSLPERILLTMPALEARTAEEMHRALRKLLLSASDQGRMRGGHDAIYRWVQLAKPPSDVSTDPRARAIVGGVKDFKRAPESAHLVRDDGAWIHFTVTVIEGKKTAPLQLHAYDFEIVLAGRPIPFVRFDLNTPSHANTARDLRSHLHPGDDDAQVPAPILSPEEALDLLVNGFR
jgi:hypothetical protein